MTFHFLRRRQALDSPHTEDALELAPGPERRRHVDALGRAGELLMVRGRGCQGLKHDLPPGDKQAAPGQPFADVVVPGIPFVGSVDGALDVLAQRLGQRPPVRQRKQLDAAPIAERRFVVGQHAGGRPVEHRVEERRDRPIVLRHLVPVDRDAPVARDVVLGGVGVVEDQRLRSGEAGLVVEQRRVGADRDRVAALPPVETLVLRPKADLGVDSVEARQRADLVDELARRTEVDHALIRKPPPEPCWPPAAIVESRADCPAGRAQRMTSAVPL